MRDLSEHAPTSEQRSSAGSGLASGPASPLGGRRPAAARAALAALALAVGIIAAGCAPFSGGGSSSGSAASPTAAARVAPTPALQGQLAQTVYYAVWGLGVQRIETTYDAAQGSVKVQITLGGSVPNTDAKVAAAQELTKAFCLMAQQALWTSGVQLTEANVTIMGPVQEEYGGYQSGVYGTSVVKASTAHGIQWATAGVDDTWQRYDDTFLQSVFVLFDGP
jgi:hypothetical protein